LELNYLKEKSEGRDEFRTASQGAEARFTGSTPFTAQDLQVLTQHPEAAGAGACHATEATCDYIYAFSEGHTHRSTRVHDARPTPHWSR